MKVEIQPYIVTDVVTRKERDGGQYRIFIDEVFVGFLPYHEGASPMLNYRYNPKQVKELQDQLEIIAYPQTISPLVMAPPAPPKPAEKSKREAFE